MIDIRVWAGPFHTAGGRRYVRACTEEGWLRWRQANEAPETFRVDVEHLLP